MAWDGVRWPKMHQWLNKIPGKFCHRHKIWLSSPRLAVKSEARKVRAELRVFLVESVDDMSLVSYVEWELNETILYYFGFGISCLPWTRGWWSQILFFVYICKWIWDGDPEWQVCLGWIETTQQYSIFQRTFLGRFPAF